MNRGFPLGLILGFAALTVVMAGGSDGPQASSAVVAPEVTARQEGTRVAQSPARYEKGEELLNAFFGEGLAPAQRIDPGGLDFDVIIASVPDPYESRMDWIYDALLAAVQRAFETGGFVLDRYWIPEPADSVLSELEGVADSVPQRRAHPGVMLFRHWNPEQPDSAGLRLVYLVGEIPTRGVHLEALENALRERERLLDRPSIPHLRFGPEVRDTIKILGPVFSGSSYSYRRALERWLSNPRRANNSVRMISGSATSPGNKPTLEGSQSRISYRATVNPDDLLMGALEPLVLDPLGIKRGEVAILKESSTAYGQSIIGGTPDGDREDFLTIPFPMNISLLRSEYARLPSVDEPMDLIPRMTEGPRVPLSLVERAGSPESPASASGLTAPTLDIVFEEITRILQTEGIKAVGLMATDVRDKLFLGEQIRERLPGVQFFTLESNVLLRAAGYRNALKGTLIISTYPLFLENQGRVGGVGPGERLSFPNDGAQGAYNAALILLGRGDAVVEYRPPPGTCVQVESAWRARAAQDPGSRGRPPIWLTAVGKTSFLPLSCVETRDPQGYLAVTPGQGRRPYRWEAGRRSTLTRAGYLLYSISVTLFALMVLWDSIFLKARPVGGKGKAADTWSLKETSHLVHIGLFRALLLIALAGLFIPLAPLPYRVGPVSIVLFVLVLVAGTEILQSFFLTRWWVDRVWGRIRSQKQNRPGFSLRSWVSAFGKKGPLGDLPRGLFGMAAIWAVVLGAAFLGLALARYAGEVSELARYTPGSFDIFAQRASQWGGGVSPFPPLSLALLGMVGWCVWNWIRFNVLRRVRPFEDMVMNARAEREGDVGERKREADKAEREAAKGKQEEDRQRPSAWQEAWARADTGFNRVRRCLLSPIPDGKGLVFALLLLPAVGWLTTRMGFSVERSGTGSGGVAFGPWKMSFGPTLEQASGIPWEGTFSAWPVVMGILVLAAILATSWAAYRLFAFWASLRSGLVAVSETPLTSAFDRLPPRVVRLTRLRFFGRDSRAMLGSMAAMQWSQMKNLYEVARKAHEESPPAGHSDQAPAEQEPPAPWFPHHLASTVDDLMEPPIGERFRGIGRSISDGETLAELRGLLTSFWRLEPTANLLPDVEEAVKGEKAGTANTCSAIRVRFSGTPGLWVRAAEEFLATQMVGYIGWAFRQMGWLAVFLLFSLLVTTALISIYPYPYQGEVKIFFFLVAVGSILALTTTVVQINRNGLLSRINGSDPDRVTWSGRFVTNLIVFGLLPLLVVLSSAFPPLRNLVMAWAEPLIRMLTSF